MVKGIAGAFTLHAMMPVVISNTAPGQYSKWGFNFSTSRGRGALNERGL